MFDFFLCITDLIQSGMIKNFLWGLRKTQDEMRAINEMELIYPGEVHAQFELREEVQNDAALLFNSTQILLLGRSWIVYLLCGINLLLLLKPKPNFMITSYFSTKTL